MRDRIRDVVTARLGDGGGTLVVAEEGFRKKGQNSAGVERQFCAASGRAGNYQIGIFLLYVAPCGAVAAIDRELLLPPSWANFGSRRDSGIPTNLPLATRDELAADMLARALDSLTPAQVVAPGTAQVAAVLNRYGVPRTPTTPFSRHEAARYFRAARERSGLGRYSVRQWRAWYRHITLSMFANTFLLVAGDSPLPGRLAHQV